MERRTFLRNSAAGSIVYSGVISSSIIGSKDVYAYKSGMRPNKTNIKLTSQISSDMEDREFQLAKQLGATHAAVNTQSMDEVTVTNYQHIVDKIRSAGLEVSNISCMANRNFEEITLNLPGRDQRIKDVIQYMRVCAKVGIHYYTYAHMGNGIWTSHREPVRGDAMARAFDLSRAEFGEWNRKKFYMPLSHGREYSEEEIWDNYEYFIKQIVPVAEDLDMKIGIHPDDPPVLTLAGVPRCIFGTFDGYARALEMANSPMIGICFCVGCWLEGGEGMGRDVLSSIEYFAGQDKLFKVHLRNIDKPLPYFIETLPDDGYMDLYKVVKKLAEVNFDGPLIADHAPALAGWKNDFSFSLGYIRGLIDRVNDEM